MQVPQAHHPQAPKAVWIGVHHINVILMLAYQHDPVDGHLCSIRGLGPFHRLLEFGAHFLVKLGGVATFQSEDFAIRRHTEDALLDDHAGVCLGHLDVGAVVLGINHGQVGWVHLVSLIHLEAFQVRFISDLMDDVNIFIGPLTGVRHHLSRRCPLLLGSDALGIQVFA